MFWVDIILVYRINPSIIKMFILNWYTWKYKSKHGNHGNINV